MDRSTCESGSLDEVSRLCERNPTLDSVRATVIYKDADGTESTTVSKNVDF